MTSDFLLVARNIKIITYYYLMHKTYRSVTQLSVMSFGHNFPAYFLTVSIIFSDYSEKGYQLVKFYNKNTITH